MHSSSGTANGFASVFSKVLKPFSGLKEDARSSIKTRLGRSHSDAVELDDDYSQKSKTDAHQTPDHESPSSQLRKEDQKLMSPAPDLEDQLKRSDPRHRSLTPYPGRERQLTSPDLDEPQVSDQVQRTPNRKDSQTINSSPPQSALKPPQKLPLNYVDITGDEETKENDQEMLMQPERETERETEPYQGPEPLDSSPLSTPLKPAQKKRPSPRSQRESDRTATPRKSPRSNQSTNVRERASASIGGRDSLESAMIGSYGFSPKQRKHIKFNEDGYPDKSS